MYMCLVDIGNCVKTNDVCLNRINILIFYLGFSEERPPSRHSRPLTGQKGKHLKFQVNSSDDMQPSTLLSG